MKLHAQSLTCLKKQIEGYLHTQSLHSDSELTPRLIREIEQTSDEIIQSHAASSLTPPQVAIAVYGNLCAKLQTSDPFARIKHESVKKAREICASLLAASPQFYPPSPSLAPSHDISHKRALLTWAIKLALLGNVIDYGSQEPFSFEGASFCLETLSFGAWDFERLFEKLEALKDRDSTLLYLADNAGENVFDKVLLETLHALYPRLKLLYMLRTQPIINDLSMADKKLLGDMEGLCEVVDSSMQSPGFVLESASSEARGHFESADLIISKGMGNFECLESHKDPRLFMLFKIKCDVVASFCALPKGKMMLLYNAPLS